MQVKNHLTPAQLKEADRLLGEAMKNRGTN